MRKALWMVGIPVSVVGLGLATFVALRTANKKPVDSFAEELKQAEAGQRSERSPDEALRHEPIDAAIADRQIRVSLDRARSSEPGRHSLCGRRWQLHCIAGSAEVVASSSW